MSALRTLVIGGEYAEIDGEIRVPERCLRMVRIFSDALAAPVHARRRVSSDDRSRYSTPLPEGAELVPVSRLGGRRPWHQAFPDRPWDRRWHRELVRRVDAVYCRFPHWEGLALYDEAIRQGKTVFASIHGDWPGVYEHLARTSSQPRRALYARLARRADATLRRVARTSRALFCVGDQLARTYGGEAQAVVTFANYLHREADIRDRSDTCTAPPYRVLFVGELEARKGVGDLLDAIARVRAAGTPALLSLVGAGEGRDALARRAAALGIADAVHFHGYVPFGEPLLELYRESDVFVLPAVAGEGLPKVIVEAMSQGLPVVATDVGSTRFVLQESGAGLLVAPGRADDLAAALERVFGDGDARRRFIAGGLAFARRTTTEHQRTIVREALERHLPELVRTA